MPAKMPCRLLVLCLVFQMATAQDKPDYKTEFGSDYQKALTWIASRQLLLDSVCRQQLVSAKFITALVFPELIRYNAVVDRLETGSLETLYVRLGKDYADFSVGCFQMKPSFAERLEKEPEATALFGLPPEQNEVQTRISRVERLENEHWQLLYLVAFLKVCETRFKHLTFRNDTEKLRFFATAYNAGYWKPEATLLAFQHRYFYRPGNLPTGKTYNYADIATFAFTH